VSKVAALAVAYVLGAIPTGLILVRWIRGTDIRTMGSGNIGATNVIRAAGWPLGVVTLVVDAIKGGLVPLYLAFVMPSSSDLLLWQIAAGTLSLLANIFNPFLKFRGGKGVGTAIGVTAVIAPYPLALALAAFGLGFGFSRIVSVGSLLAGTAFGLGATVIYYTGSIRPPALWLGFCLAVAALVLVTHRANIKRLIAGQESPLTRQE
jgi:glycerol-3-phosphate acyltransferase PlsY